MDIKKFLKGEAQGGLNFFFYILLYYFINVMIKTLYISNFIVVYIKYFTHSLYCYVLIPLQFLTQMVETNIIL